MKKYYSYETWNKENRDALRVFLHQHEIYYELSGCFDGWHFEVECTPEELIMINNFLDTLEVA